MAMNITELAVKLRLPYSRDNWQQLVNEARHTKQDYVAFLENLFDCEWRLRLENGQAKRIKVARFPLGKYLVDFKREKYDELFVPKFEELETLAFIKNKENIILIGTPGADKTHYSIALGIAGSLKTPSHRSKVRLELTMIDPLSFLEEIMLKSISQPFLSIET